MTCHDGFTLNDLVSYDGKHNEANGEDSRDGTDDNRSWNCGVEGPTDDLDVIALRERQKRNFLATLFLSQGVPMLLHGDEIGRTQDGNNNAYCQDNEISWVDWTGLRDGQFFDERGPLLDFVRRLSALRTGHPVFRRRRRPGQSKIVTQRDEADVPEIWSGVFEGKTDGTRSASCSATPTSAAATTATSRTSTAPATPTSPSTPSTASATTAAAGGPAPARRSAASPPGPWRRSCWRRRASRVLGYVKQVGDVVADVPTRRR